MSIPTLKKIQDILLKQDACIEFLIEKDIIKKQEKCQYCDSLVFKYKKFYRCKNTNCRKLVSVFKDSFFSKQHLQCSDVLTIGYYWLLKTKLIQIGTITAHSPKIIIKYIKKFRGLAIDSLRQDDFIIGGNKIIIEIDESKFHDFWIFGGIERTNQKKCFFVIVNDRNKQTLRKLIKKHIRPRSIIYSDSWKAYHGLDELNYVHKTINHTKHLYDPRTHVHTNHIENQ
jgi:hypothetical protein